MELSIKNDKLVSHFQAERDMVDLRSKIPIAVFDF